MAPEIEKLEEIVLQLRCGEVLNLDESADLLDDAIREIERLREGLRLITCEPINAEYMAQNILDGLPAYHDTMLVPNEPPNADVTGCRRQSGGQTC